MSDKQEKFLQQLHEKFTTSDDIIAGIVGEASGSELESKTRIIAGEVNEVWRVSVEDGPDLILRISHRSDPGFLRERAAIDKLKQVGLPVPQVLLIKQFKDGLKSKTACVETVLEGKPLSKIDIGAGELPHYARQIAGALDKIHSVRVGGFAGRLNEDGDSEERTFTEFMTDMVPKKAELQKQSVQADIPPGSTDRALDILVGHTPVYKSVTEATLTHGDFGGDHLFFKDGRLSGVIDFEGVSGAGLSFDLAWWDLFWRRKIPTELIIAELSAKPENLDQLINLQALRLALTLLPYYTETRNPGGLEHTKQGLEHYLDKFK